MFVIAAPISLALVVRRSLSCNLYSTFRRAVQLITMVKHPGNSVPGELYTGMDQAKHVEHSGEEFMY